MSPKRRKPQPPAPSTITNTIPLPYRLFHLYIEPLLLLPGGIFLTLFRPEQFLLSTTPYPAIQASIAPHDPSSSSTASATQALITPVTTLLLTNTAGLYIVFMLNELLTLRLSSDLRIWRVVIGAMLACDVLHVWGVWVAGGGWQWVSNPGLWRAEDWINQVILFGGVLLRAAFMAGLGLGAGDGKGEVQEKKKKG